MNETNLEYIKSLKPAPHINGCELLSKGVEIGRTIKAGRGGFIRNQTKYKTHGEYKEDIRQKGKIYWNILMGLGSLEAQIKGIKDLYEFSQDTGLEINRIQTICSQLIGLPKELRGKAPSTTSFIMEDFDDYEAQQTAAPIDIVFQDFITTSPDGLFNTICGVQSGSQDIGVFTHFPWKYPGYDDDIKQFSNVVKALGVLSSKRDEGFAIASYPEDGFAAYFMDYISFVGYVLLENYICDHLCNVRLSVEYGGLMTDVGIRAAIGMAIHSLLSTNDNKNPIVYINGSTTQQWDNIIEANYGISVPEFLFTILVEKKYKLSLGIQPVSITEKLRVPTVNELKNIFAAGKRTEENAENWLPFMNFEPLEKMRDDLINQGKLFFKNTLNGFEKAGIDIKDPLEMLLVLKNFDPNRFEKCFHPSTFSGQHYDVVPIYPTEIKKHLEKLQNKLMQDLEKDGFIKSLKGRKVILGSADTHVYGIMLVNDILSKQGANIHFGGVDMTPVDFLDLADEADTLDIGISCHNGQALDYAYQIQKLAKDRKKKYRIFMGGKLNSILPGDTEPSNVSDTLNELGIISTNDIISIVKILSKT